MIRIERGVPIPRAERGGGAVYPFRMMQVGDSFRVPVSPGRDAQTLQKRISSNAWNFCQRTPGYRFVTRVIEGGQAVRCWRAPVMSMLDITPAVPVAGSARVHVLRDDDEPERRTA